MGSASDQRDAPLDTEVSIETPEHIVFQHRVAGPARRAVAQVLDLLLCYGVIAFLGLLVFLATMRGTIDTGEIGELAKAGIGLVLLALFAAQWLYFLVCEGRWGRSPGKAAMGLAVVTTEGRPIGWRAAALRNLLRAVDLLPTAYVAGVVSMALTSRFQRLGDLVAGTMVITRRVARSEKALALSPPASSAELANLPDAVALDHDERAAIELFLRRQDRLGVVRARELASMIAPDLAARLAVKLGADADPARFLALVHDRAINTGRSDGPPSLFPGKAGGGR